eukprot:Tbor_TRINITY_DN5484_c2_g1::TRINITY_DN5484_c2_g1_i1::g.25023::m.25023
MPHHHQKVYDDIEPPELYGDGNEWDRHIDRVLSVLLDTYTEIIEPIEKRFEYDTFNPSWFGETIVQKKPFITLLGPFSSGKSTFVNYLMQSNYLLTGPQPVTDKFTVIMHGASVGQVSGKVLAADQRQPFRGLNQFGDKFIECFGGVTCPHPILKSVSLIDTPGVLENSEGDHGRRYDYNKVCRWFVERSDVVCVLFDPAKLDVGAELRSIFKVALRGYENKLRIILNKADSITPQELMRVYGALFWSLSTLIKTTEPPRVYVSSFWDQPYKPDTNHILFTEEKSDLLYDLTDAIPQQSLDNRVTSVISRCKAVYNHVLVCTYLKSKLPVFKKETALNKLLENLPEIYKELAHKYKCCHEDFPKAEEYVRFFQRVDITKLPDAEKCHRRGWLANLSNAMGNELPQLIKPIQTDTVSDPRDRKHAIMIQREYNAKLVAQLEGKKGIQGGLGEMMGPGIRSADLPNAAQMMSQIQDQQRQLQQQMMGQDGGASPVKNPDQGTSIHGQVVPMQNLSYDQMQAMLRIMQQTQVPRVYQPRF